MENKLSEIFLSTRRKWYLILLLFLINYQPLVSNNIQISNVSIYSQNITSHNCQIKLDLSWENSWRVNTGANNWDAAWIFVKFKKGTNGIWQHATLSTNSADHFPSLGATIYATNDGKGVFIYKNSIGIGNNYFNETKLLWNYGLDGVTESDTIQIKAIGIEMVYVPQGSFFAGDHNASTASFIQGSNDNDPWYINSENEINVTGGTGTGTGVGQYNAEYYYQDYYGPSGTTFAIPAEFPKGFAAFYCMKYEISMGQYVEFLNMLTRQQQNARTNSDISTSDIDNYYVMANTNFESYGNTITCPATNNGTTQPIIFETNTPDRACNYFNWSDLAAILDWSGLRPMTELEFEKACRGNQSAFNGEYAWGNTNIYTTEYTIINTGSSSESIYSLSINIGNAIYSLTTDSTQRPLRCGIFSGSAFNNSREETGATYYGIMEMSGNVIEFTITVGNPYGYVFTNINGNGLVDPLGNSDVPSWPGIDAYGSGLRGGALGTDNISLGVSNRMGVEKAVTNRSPDVGGRGVRSAY